jgi:membrane fusion protein (multidrug efflux system)
MASRTAKRMGLMLLAVVLLVAVLASVKFLQIRTMIANLPKPQAQVVSAIKAQMLEWQPQLAAIGSLVAVRGVDVSSEVAGQVRAVRFKSGQDVRAGQVLVQLNADADLALQRSLRAAADLAAQVLARDREQFAAQAVSQAQIEADEADLRVKRANLAQQEALVAKKTIRAPFAGRVGITTVAPGQFLAAGEKVVTLQTLDPIYVDFTLPQSQLGALKTGLRVVLTDDAHPQQTFAGRISAISPKVDPATRNLLVEATVANPQRLLLPGMFARVEIEIGDKQRRLTLPQTAITYNPYGSTVFVVEPGEPRKVRQVFVVTGATRGDQVAITSGISEGDEIVTSGQVKLKNGTEVRIDNSVQPANSPNPKPQER